MKTLVGHYTNPKQAAHDYPALDLTAPMGKSDFADITGAYNYPEAGWVNCQLEIDGAICKQAHGVGWIMLRKDGVEGYIGGVCARDHFQADEVFAGAAAKARRDIRIQNLVDRLGNLIVTRDVLRQRIVDVFERQQRLRKRVGKIRNSLPYVVMDRLHHMTKTGDRNVRLEFRHVEKDEDRDGKVIHVVRWRPDIVATVAAPQALEVGPIEEIGDKLRIALAAANAAEANPDRTEREMRHWAESIEAVDRCEAELEEVELALAVFVDPSNLRGLCWVCRKDADQTKSARAAIRAAGAWDDDAGARRARDAWREELKASRGGIEFSVP